MRGTWTFRSGAKLEATTNSVQFISPSVAVEHGTAKVILADQEPEDSEYTAVYVRRDGQWLLDRVTEEDVIEVPSHYEQLKDLEWLVGRWTDRRPRRPLDHPGPQRLGAQEHQGPLGARHAVPGRRAIRLPGPRQGSPGPDQPPRGGRAQARQEPLISRHVSRASWAP